MIYLYKCQKCNKNFDIIKSSDEHRKEEKCKCGEVGERVFVVPHISADTTQVGYNPGLGMVIKNKAHLKDVMKQKGLIEIGNEKPESLHKQAEKTKNDKFEKRWNETLKEM